MTETSARFFLPFILPGQAQKEVFHNEALAMLDAALHACIAGGATTEIPAVPLPGDSWLVGSGAAGAWADQTAKLATWTGGGWRFTAPVPGMTVWNIDAGYQLLLDGNGLERRRMACLRVNHCRPAGRRPAPRNGSKSFRWNDN